MLKHIRGIILCYVIVTTFNTFTASAQIAQHTANVEVIDAQLLDFSNARMSLDGLWTFYANQLLTPAECAITEGSPAAFPQSWSNAKNDSIDYGTFHVKILVSSSVHELALELPQMYNSYNCYVNANLIAQNGIAGTTKEKTKPQWHPQAVSFKNTGDTIDVVLQIAGFYHNIGGIRESIFLTSPEMAHKNYTFSVTSNLVEVILLTLEAILFIIIYFVSHKERVVLYFSFLCLSWALRSVFSNIYPITIFFPDFNWNWLIRIEYITLYSTTAYGILFLHRLFDNVNNQVVKYTLVSVNIFFVLFTLFADPIVFSRWLSLYLAVSTITLIYGICIVFMALIREQTTGAWLLISSILLGITLFGCDLFSYKGLFKYNNLVMNTGYIVIFLLVTISLLIHLSIIKKVKSDSVLTFDELYRQEQ